MCINPSFECPLTPDSLPHTCTYTNKSFTIFR